MSGKLEVPTKELGVETRIQLRAALILERDQLYAGAPQALRDTYEDYIARLERGEISGRYPILRGLPVSGWYRVLGVLDARALEMVKAAEDADSWGPPGADHGRLRAGFDRAVALRKLAALHARYVVKIRAVLARPSSFL